MGIKKPTTYKESHNWKEKNRHKAKLPFFYIVWQEHLSGHLLLTPFYDHDLMVRSHNQITVDVSIIENIRIKKVIIKERVIIRREQVLNNLQGEWKGYRGKCIFSTY